MRTIKFRAWHKETKEMFQVGQITLEKGIWDYQPDDRKYIGVSIPYQPSFTLMQFTGLHDKNGKEIYEGDIVNMHYFLSTYDKSILEFIEHEQEETGIIKINEYGIYLENKNGEIFYLVYYVQEPRKELEVIGNIYKNKELLNETNRK